MARSLLLAAVAFLVAGASGAAPAPAAPGPRSLVFEALEGEGASSSRFVARARGYQAWIESGRLLLRPDVAPRRRAGSGAVPIELRFVGADSSDLAADPHGELRRRSVSHYLKGGEPARRDVPHFARLRQPGLAAGVDLVYYGREGELEYDFEIAPGADPASVEIELPAATQLRIDAAGMLVADFEDSTLRQAAPIAWQHVAGERRPVASRWELRGPSRVGFAVEAYDPAAPLVIDPVLSFSTYLGGTGFDVGRRVVADAAGNVLLIGRTAATDLPVKDALQPAYGGAEHDAFLAKYDEGGDLIFSTYLGGSGEDWGYDVDLDAAGNIYVCGRTASTDLPAQRGFQLVNGGGIDAFVAKLDPTGSEILYLTYLGGTGQDRTRGLVVASDGSVFATGQTDSTDLPTVNPLQAAFGGGDRDVLLAHISPHGGTLLFSSYLGGVADDVGVNLRVRDGGDVVVTGFTSSADFPTVTPHQATKAGTYDLFVLSLARDTSALVYSTFLGGSGDGSADPDEQGLDVDLDRAQNAYVAGRSSSTDFPVLGALQPTLAGDWDATLSKLAPDGTLLYSTYLGGSARDESRALAVDDDGRVFVTGRTTSSDFPTLDPVQATLGGTEDAFVTVVEPDGSSLVSSTYLGGADDDDGFGIDLDYAGHIYLAGETRSLDFPARSPEQPAIGGFFDGFLTRIATGPEATVSLADDGGTTRLTLVLRNADIVPRDVVLKFWIEIPALGALLPVISQTYALPAGYEIPLIANLVLPAGLPFPGTVIGARLLDADDGALLHESLCSEVSCH